MGLKTAAGILVLSLCFTAPALFGLVLTGLLTGAWWPLVAYGACMVLFFGIIEIRILCCHCPFYTEEGDVLHCLGNHGAPKFWRHRPGPLKAWEQSSLITGFVIFGGAPLAALGYNIWFTTTQGHGTVALLGMIGLAAATLFVGLGFYNLLRVHVCPRCVNFSCPLNLVTKDVVDAYLRLNPEMRAAWEKSGYRID